MAARLVAHVAVIAAGAAVMRALAVLHALKGQCPPAGGRNGSRIAMCRAHSHAVPHTRTVEHDQHWQRSLRWMRKALQNDEPEIGLCEPRLRFLLAEAMQAMQAAAMLRSAPQKPTMIIYEDHQSSPERCLARTAASSLTTRRRLRVGLGKLCTRNFRRHPAHDVGLSLGLRSACALNGRERRIQEHWKSCATSCAVASSSSPQLGAVLPVHLVEL